MVSVEARRQASGLLVKAHDRDMSTKTESNKESNEPTNRCTPVPSSDPWRYRCPRGHADWNQEDGHFKCSTCGVVFEQLRDAKTGGVVDA